MIANRTFTKADQTWFAQRAGDWNPIHIDEIAARRLVFGETVVHGIHICLWAINAAMRFEKPHNSLSHIKVRFESPLPVGVEVSLVSIEDNGQEKRLLVRTDRTLVRISLTFNDKNQPIDNLSYDKNKCDFSPQSPKFHTIASLNGAKGTCSIPMLDDEVAKAFKYLLSAIGPGVIAELMACSRLVGMDCPGMCSVFGGLTLSVSKNTARQAMTYFVRQMDPRFSMITMSVDGAHLEGEIKAFYYQPPVVQPSMIDLKSVVVSKEFTGHKILVVGASRGLGEVVSKLVAEGGGEVILTYHKGQQEAEAIVSEISARGGNATCVAIDVTNPNLTLDAFGTVMSDISAVFYFASPKISGTRSGNFDVGCFNRMANVFVGGACRIVSLVASVCRPNALIFYPSTVFLDDDACGWSEYCAAKSAGETAWAKMGAAYSNLRFVCQRLPRILTDQNVGIQEIQAQSAVPVMMPLLRDLLSFGK